jgi:hypothetical protein
MRRQWVLLASAAGICGVVLAVGGATRMLAQTPEEDSFITATLRQESRNKLKQILLALHTYADKHKHFPAGTIATPGVPRDKRLSWQVEILPFFEQQALYEQIALDKPWDDKANASALATAVPGFLNPGVEKTKEGDRALTHYVGLAGVGADGPTLPVASPRAGCFAYDRTTRLEDIKDGTSNTAMLSEVSKDYGSWAAGGRPTLRPFTKEPVVNGPDGLGGPWKEGMLVGFADGSVRFVSKQVDPKLFKALVTINGGEPVKIR